MILALSYISTSICVTVPWSRGTDQVKNNFRKGSFLCPKHGFLPISWAEFIHKRLVCVILQEEIWWKKRKKKWEKHQILRKLNSFLIFLIQICNSALSVWCDESELQYPYKLPFFSLNICKCCERHFPRLLTGRVYRQSIFYVYTERHKGYGRNNIEDVVLLRSQCGSSNNFFHHIHLAKQCKLQFSLMKWYQKLWQTQRECHKCPTWLRHSHQIKQYWWEGGLPSSSFHNIINYIRWPTWGFKWVRLVSFVLSEDLFKRIWILTGRISFWAFHILFVQAGFGKAREKKTHCFLGNSCVLWLCFYIISFFLLFFLNI